MDSMARNGFVASMLHDIGKLALNDQKEWPEHHWDLETIGKMKDIDIDFCSILGKDVLEIIKTHHGNVQQDGKFKKRYDISKLSNAQIALALADKIESSLTERDEGNGKFNKLNNIVKFNPFYGNPSDIKKHEAHGLLKEIEKKLLSHDVETLMEIQKIILRYPYQHYYPHISLGIHHRLTAALYILLYHNLIHLKSPIELREFTVYLIEVDLQPMNLFYRLRDIVAYSEIAEQISSGLFRKYFKNYIDLVNFKPSTNPFTFYYKDGMVFLSDERLKKQLSDILQGIQGINSLDVRTLTLTFPIDWKQVNDNEYSIYLNPKSSIYHITQESLISERVFAPFEEAFQHCESCGIPITSHTEERLCNDCKELRNRFSSKIDIDKVSTDNGANFKIAYVFLNLPDLLYHAKEIAEKVLINRFTMEVRLSPGDIQPTRYGFLEFLQALQEMKEFQEKMEGTTKDMRKEQEEKPISNILFQTSERMCVVLREDFLWEFIGSLNAHRYDLQLNSSTTVFITRKKTPLWSLMKRVSEYVEGDTLYDVTRGEVIMFSARETQYIRELAMEALRRGVPQFQLNRLSKFALHTNIDELMLEIDRSADRLRGLERLLKDKLQGLEYEGKEFQHAEKRSVFLKYVADLIKVQRERRR